MPGLIERYRDRLPFADGDPVVTMGEGSTPLVHAPWLSERVGAEVWLKLAGAVIVPEGKIATGKLAQALMHGARVIALRGNFDQALQLVRQLVERHPIALVNSVNPFRLEGQKTAAFELLDDLGPIDALAIPVGNAGNITAYWKGFQEVDERPMML